MRVGVDDEQDAPEPIASELVVDLLVPEGLGPRIDITTVGNASAFPAPGVSQALRRTQRVPVAIDQRTVWFPRPDLLGAIVAKATACDVDPLTTSRHHTDLVFLCGLVDDPMALATQADRKDRRRLRRATSLLPSDHDVWRSDRDARVALELLVDPPPL